MTDIKVTFKTQTSFRGRNGGAYCKGLHIRPCIIFNKVLIRPITSRNNISDSCKIWIEKDDLPSLIKGLQIAYKSLQKELL